MLFDLGPEFAGLLLGQAGDVVELLALLGQTELKLAIALFELFDHLLLLQLHPQHREKEHEQDQAARPEFCGCMHNGKTLLSLT